MVINSVSLAPPKSPPRIRWWHHVKESPEASRITVFRRGTPKGLAGALPAGGHVSPSSRTGERLM